MLSLLVVVLSAVVFVPEVGRAESLDTESYSVASWGSGGVTMVKSDTTTWEGEFGTQHVVDGSVNNSQRVIVKGTVDLFLNEGATLTVPKGITVSKGNTLTIQGTGKLEAGNSKDNTWNAAIGGTNGKATGTIIIKGGTVTATAGEYAAGIGGGFKGAGATVTVGGSAVVVATGGTDAVSRYNPCVGIGCGSENTDHGTLAINSGSWLYGSASSIDAGVSSTDYFLSSVTDSYTGDRYQYMVVNGNEEVHNFEYTSDGTTITATCSVEHCSLEDHKVTLTIVAPRILTYDGTAKVATLEGLDEFNAATGASVAESDISYYPARKTEDGHYAPTGAALESAPTDVGDYEALIVAKSNPIKVGFTIVSSAYGPREKTPAEDVPTHDPVAADKEAGSISYATTSVVKTYGDGTFTNELTKTGDGAVAYASSNEGVATVDSSTGEVTIVGVGSATITATVEDSASYAYEVNSVSYTLTLRKRSSGGGGSGATPSSASVQMWRLYNPNSGEHFYTASAGERDLLVEAKWNYEGVAWYGVK